MRLEVKTKLQLIVLIGSLATITVAGCNTQTDSDNTINTEEVSAPGGESNQRGRLSDINDQIKLTSNDPKLYYDKALIHFENLNLKDAKGDIDRAIYLDSTNNTYLSLKSDILYFSGEIEESRDFIKLWLEVSPLNKEPIIKLAKLHLLLEDYDSSLVILDKAQVNDRNNPQIYFYRGMSYKGKGDLVSAVHEFQNAVAINQRYIQAHVQLGLIFSEREDMRCIKYFNQAILGDTLCLEAYYGKAMYYQNSEDPDMAKEVYEQMLAISPEHLNALYNLGYLNLIYYEDFLRGAEYFTKVIELDNKNINAIYNRGYCFQLQGDKKKAEADFRHALSIDPQYTLAAQRLNELL